MFQSLTTKLDRAFKVLKGQGHITEINVAETVKEIRKALLEAYLPYVEMETARGTPATILVRHLYGLFNGKPGARKYRQYLGENAPKTNNPAEMIRRAMDLVTEP